MKKLLLLFFSLGLLHPAYIRPYEETKYESELPVVAPRIIGIMDEFNNDVSTLKEEIDSANKIFQKKTLTNKNILMISAVSFFVLTAAQNLHPESTYKYMALIPLLPIAPLLINIKEGSEKRKKALKELDTLAKIKIYNFQRINVDEDSVKNDKISKILTQLPWALEGPNYFHIARSAGLTLPQVLERAKI